MKTVEKFLRVCLKSAAPLLLILTPECLLLHAQPVTIVPIQGLGGSFFSPSALNSHGDITGYFFTGGFAQHAFLYSGGNYIDLMTLGGSSSAGNALNDLGQVAGDSWIANDAQLHAFFYANGSMRDVGTIGGNYATAAAVNNAGMVAGDSTTAAGANHAFLFNGAAIFDLGTLGGNNSSAVGLNNVGQVAGNSTLANGRTHAFLYNGGMQDLQTLGGISSQAAALNDLGEVVGESFTVNNQKHAFVYRNGAMSDLGTLGGTSSTAYAINASGQIAGDSLTAGGQSHAFLFSNGQLLDLGTLGGNYSTAYALNNLGQVVGDSANGGGISRAYLWRDGTMIDLNTLLAPNSGWDLYTAQFINDAGQIVGYGFLNGNFAWFLLSPAAPVNHPPQANAGPDQTVECAGASTTAHLDGSASSDPDGDSLSYEWSENGTVLGNSAVIDVHLALGSHTIKLVVTDTKQTTGEDTVVVQVVDTMPPVIQCPQPVQLAAGQNCEASLPDFLANLQVSDNCASRSELGLEQNPPAGTVLPLGVHNVTLAATDRSGHRAECSVQVTVADVTPPQVLCPDPVRLSTDQNCQALLPDFTRALAASDNCSSRDQLRITQTPAAGTLLSVGDYQVTLVVEDRSGNRTTCTTTVTVADLTPPQVVCPDPVRLSTDQNCQALLPDFTQTLAASDNCSSRDQLRITQTPAAGTLLSVGDYQVTLVVEDGAGNRTTCAVAVSVRDTTAPVIVALSVTPNQLVPANNKMVPVQISAQVVDNCDPQPVVELISITSNEPVTDQGDKTSPDWAITGPLTADLRAERSAKGNGRIYTLTVRATDASGNASTQTVIVTVPKGKN